MDTLCRDSQTQLRGRAVFPVPKKKVFIIIVAESWCYYQEACQHLWLQSKSLV